LRMSGCFRLLLIVLLPMTALLLTAAAKTTVNLSPYAEAVAKIINFDRKVLIIMKQETGGSISRMVGYDENHYRIIANGLVIPVADVRTGEVLSVLRRKFKPLGYMAFVVDMNEGIKTDKIGVLKGTDKYEILRIMDTNGEEYDITNNDVIERLRQWEKTWPFDIIGANNDWVELEFKVLPNNLIAFVEEVYEFCPDAVEKGPGSTADLAREIMDTKRLFLLWD
jgi:hypothetical protein